MVTMRSRPSMNADIAFSIVVLPEPVPPEISTLRRAFTIAANTSATGAGTLPISTSRSMLIGTRAMAIPDHPQIRHLGYVSDQDKFDAIAAASVLVMPSYFESLSMVALEAWALGRPVHADAHCDVLVGQCLRSNAGLYYENAHEFAGALHRLLSDERLSQTLGRNGREYYTRHYAWPVIEGKYLEMFTQLISEPASRTMEPLPGFFARRQRTLTPALDVLNALPAGPARMAAVVGRHS